ncbi:ATP-grasp domain-containing protein [Sporosarcina sp. ACRSM]|uniref:ATP-grasp domain-containing protein n=1 Tax=Sporosarcina sp. ACRSM TaxID=2918216 RepID=UPI001EF716D7|nr:ATP-grasp domain-containing protein [Sporosarcina sp. ACRSM]MCG7334417.1 ATP-grasp domain-containing protein [Sporosarcina sp. ACRSM]
METILFIETTKLGSSREALKVAARLGYRTVLLTERRSFIEQQDEFAEVAQMIHFEKLTEERIRTTINQLQEQGAIMKTIISFVDPFVSIAAQLANEYCGAQISVEALKIMEDKAATRKELKQHDATPNFEIIDLRDDWARLIHNGYKYPMIVKSALSKASKDVYVVENKIEMQKILKKLTKQDCHQKIILEEYLDGPQYLVEVLVRSEKSTIVAIVQQDITQNLKFIVTGYAVKLDVKDEFYQKLVQAVESIIKELKISNAACHLECRFVNGEWKLIEMNPRIAGGAMNRMIEEAFGIHLVGETIKLYLGIEPDLTRKFEKSIYTRYIIIGSCGYLLKVIGEQKAKAQPGVKEVSIKPGKGTIMMPALSMGHRYGYVIASGDTPEEAKTNAVNAANHIKFYLELL